MDSVAGRAADDDGARTGPAPGNVMVETGFASITVALNFPKCTDHRLSKRHKKTAPAEAGAVSIGSILTTNHPNGLAETRTGEKPITRF